MATELTTILIDRLASLPNLAGIPRKELKWLVEHGRYGVYEAGTVIAPKGKRVHNLWIILSGSIAVRVDRGVGPRLVTEWHSGEVSGMLPYSRMIGPPGDNYIEEKAQLLAINVKLFPEMIHYCQTFTAYTVHCMLDRARNFNTSDLQDEKMISLGKLSAGLAHELNNPASAIVSDAKILIEDLINMNTTSQAIGSAGLTNLQFNKIENMRAACLAKSDVSLSPIQKADHQDKISDWLVDHHLNPDFAVPLADNSITTQQLENLAKTVPDKALDVVLKWIVASASAHSLAIEIKHAATQIYKIVDAVKKFTYMGNLVEKELTRVEPGIRDTLSVLVSKAQSKNAAITLELDANLPQVFANGSDLNQVWFCLLDNALDAISHSGNISIRACSEMNRVVVSIINDGQSIASDVITRIFDPFFTTKPQGHGTGLGLDIARRFLRRYHGDISVHSQPGKTEFRVNLLLMKPESAATNQSIEDKSKK
jgi:signal transduction histidine kinase